MITAALLLLLPVQSPPQARPIAIRDATLVCSADRTIARGTLVLRHGLIDSLGEDVEPPYDAEIIDGTGLVVYPGFFDGFQRTGLPEKVRTDEDRAAAEAIPPDWKTEVSPRMEPANRKGLYPEFRACRSVALKEEERKKYHEAGIAFLVVAPPVSLLGGTAVLLSLNGETRRLSILRADAFLLAGFRTEGDDYPRSLLGTVAHLRQVFLDARTYREQWRFYSGTGRRPPYDPALEAIAPALDGALPVGFEAETEGDIRRALSLAEEFRLRFWIAGGEEAHKLASELKDAGTAVLLRLNWPEEPGKHPSGEPEPEKLKSERRRLWEERVRCAIRLHEAGVPFVFSSHALDSPTGLLAKVRELIERGLAREAAVAALTEVPARIFGLGESAGTLVPGRLANLTVLTAPLGEKKSRVRYVFADGVRFEIEDESKKKPDVDVSGTWRFTAEAESGTFEGTLTLKQAGGDVQGAVSAEKQEPAEIRGGKVAGRRLTFSFTVEVEGTKREFEVSAELKEKDLQGTIEGPQGTRPWKAVREPEGE